METWKQVNYQHLCGGGYRHPGGTVGQLVTTFDGELHNIQTD